MARTHSPEVRADLRRAATVEGRARTERAREAAAAKRKQAYAIVDALTAAGIRVEVPDDGEQVQR
jgi:hypothetical protein